MAKKWKVVAVCGRLGRLSWRVWRATASAFSERFKGDFGSSFDLENLVEIVAFTQSQFPACICSPKENRGS